MWHFPKQTNCSLQGQHNNCAFSEQKWHRTCDNWPKLVDTLLINENSFTPVSGIRNLLYEGMQKYAKVC